MNLLDRDDRPGMTFDIIMYDSRTSQYLFKRELRGNLFSKVLRFNLTRYDVDVNSSHLSPAPSLVPSTLQLAENSQSFHTMSTSNETQTKDISAVRSTPKG